MRKIILIIIILISFNTNSYSSEIKFYFNPGLGFYSMSSLSYMNSQARSTLPFTPKQISDFPAYWNFNTGIEFISEITKGGFGFNYSFETTGSRMSLADYSGEYYNNFTANAHNFSISIIYFPEQEIKLPVLIDFLGGYKITSLKNVEYFNIGGTDTTNNAEFTANSIFLEPGVKILFPYKFFEVGFRLGYQLDFGGEYKIVSINGDKSHAGSPIANPKNQYKALETEWSGFRMNLLLMVNLNKLFNKN